MPMLGTRKLTGNKAILVDPANIQLSYIGAENRQNGPSGEVLDGESTKPTLAQRVKIRVSRHSMPVVAP